MYAALSSRSAERHIPKLHQDLHQLSTLPQILVLALFVFEQLDAGSISTRDVALISLDQCITLTYVVMHEFGMPYSKCYSRGSSHNEIKKPTEKIVMIEKHAQLGWQNYSPLW